MIVKATPEWQRPTNMLQKDRRRGSRNRRAGREGDRRSDLDREYFRLFEEYRKYCDTKTGKKILEAIRQKTFRLHWDVLVTSVAAALENEKAHEDSRKAMLEMLKERSEALSLRQLAEFFGSIKNQKLHMLVRSLIRKRIGRKIQSETLACLATIMTSIDFSDSVDPRVEILQKLAGLPPK